MKTITIVVPVRLAGEIAITKWSEKPLRVSVPDNFDLGPVRPVGVVECGQSAMIILENTGSLLLRRDDPTKREYVLVAEVCFSPPDDERPLPDLGIRVHPTQGRNPTFHGGGTRAADLIHTMLNITLKW